MSRPTSVRALRWLFAIQLVSMGAMDMSAPFWPMHLRDLGGLSASALAQASALAYAGPLFAAMCCTPLWGRAADRVGHKPMVLRALAALAATQAWIAFADSVGSVLAARVVQGALAGFIAAAQAYGAQLCERDQRARLIARLQVATAIGSVAGPFIGGCLYGATGFRAINAIAATLCALCALAAWCVLPTTAQRQAQQPGPAHLATPARAVVPTMIAGMLAGIVAVQLARSMPQAFFGLYAEKVLALPAWATGLCYGVTALGLSVGAPLWARRFDRNGRARVLGEAAIVAWVCALLTLAQSPAIPVLVLLLARLAWGFALGALLPVFYALLSRDAPCDAQGRTLGWGNAAAKAGALVGSALGGLALAVLPLQWLMLPVAAGYAVAALVLHALRRRAAYEEPPPPPIWNYARAPADGDAAPPSVQSALSVPARPR
ncbi:MAG TPA: MFS transporter [Burkholderiaceae bacterium]|nr:MFS transporter [Burkholderiaceae bacterium]